MGDWISCVHPHSKALLSERTDSWCTMWMNFRGTTWKSTCSGLELSSSPLMLWILMLRMFNSLKYPWALLYAYRNTCVYVSNKNSLQKTEQPTSTRAASRGPPLKGFHQANGKQEKNLSQTKRGSASSSQCIHLLSALTRKNWWLPGEPSLWLSSLAVQLSQPWSKSQACIPTYWRKPLPCFLRGSTDVFWHMLRIRVGIPTSSFEPCHDAYSTPPAPCKSTLQIASAFIVQIPNYRHGQIPGVWKRELGTLMWNLYHLWLTNSVINPKHILTCDGFINI